jgi:hypothetical protein
MNVSMATPCAEQSDCLPEDTEIRERSLPTEYMRIVALIACRSDVIVDIGFSFLILCYLAVNASLWLR